MEAIRVSLNPAVVELKLRTLTKKLGELTYDECVSLAREAEETLKALSPFDPAIEYFIRQRISYYQYAELLNLHQGLARDEHAEPIQVLYSLGDDVYEGCVYLPRYFRLGASNPSSDLQINQMVVDHHDWRNLDLRTFELTVQ